MNERKSDGRANYRDYLAKWKKKLTKENMAVVALLGLLLMVIAIPADSFPGRRTGEYGERYQGRNVHGAGGHGDGGSGRWGRCRIRRGGIRQTEGGGAAGTPFRHGRSGRSEGDDHNPGFGEQVVEKDVPSESGWVSETDSAGGTRESESARQEESTVYITDSEGNRTPYISQTTQPEIEGVTVVAQGGGDALIQKNITEVIQALFDIEAHKIKVVKMK